MTLKNISFLNRTEVQRASKVALARIRLSDMNYRNSQSSEEHRVVTMEFQYANLVLNEEERFLNPLGFLVTDYQIAQEVMK